jgi:glycosyltransferase involved in cell wall biosynthesis
MSPRVQPAQSSKKQTANKPAARGVRTTVLHLCADLEPGSPSRETVDLAVLTQRAGWRALIASQGGLLVNEAERAAVRHTRMPLGGGMLAGWRNRIQLATLIQKEQPVLIHAHGIGTAAHALGAVRAHRLPLVVDCTDPLPERSHTHHLMKQLGKLACVIRVPSHYMAQHVVETFKWPEERLQIVPPGIDMQWNYAAAISAERLQALSRLWRLPEQATVIVMPMPFSAGGGHKQLLEAVANFKREDVFAVLVGDNRAVPGMHDEIENCVTQLGLDGKVIMPDYCLDWPAACWLANIVVAPNTAPRGQALELLVAQAIGRPVVVSDCGANREMMQEDETGLVVPPDDSRALGRALSEAMGFDTARRLDLTHRTRGFIGGAFPQANWFNSMMEIYDSLLIPATRRAKAAA